jgi:hypothetical protein
LANNLYIVVRTTGPAILHLVFLPPQYDGRCEHGISTGSLRAGAALKVHQRRRNAYRVGALLLHSFCCWLPAIRWNYLGRYSYFITLFIYVIYNKKQAAEAWRPMHADTQVPISLMLITYRSVRKHDVVRGGGKPTEGQLSGRCLSNCHF